MTRNRPKAFLVSAALLGGTLLMSACNQGNDAADSSSGKTDTAAAANKSGAKGVSGTFSGGTVKYLASGKYIVSVSGKSDQQFWIADDTKILGAGTICGDASSKVDAPCEETDLETATKGGRSVNADVEMKDGAATQITERRASASSSGGSTSGGGSTTDPGSTSGGGATTDPGSTSGGGEGVVDGLNKGKGVNGTWYGIVRYMAPGKYQVDGPAAQGSGGEQQAFYLAEDTVILGGGQICGTAGSKVDAPCEEADLEKAAKKGVEAEVVIENGIATKITDGALL
ncbi:hypothetical protein OHU34_21905 [Streptomyces sp. NBC_00080]|uniref:hypothetical protein n=1 Tax=Streptomyces TaxID=1883 RepID=UPI00114D6453|nr:MULTISPECIES: hypothetical protein [Streptomyces]TQJ54160.1 hypothetical protein FBY34_1926 [Streptomyces sp. SLBN-115]